MAITIKINDVFRYTDPTLLQNPNNYAIQIMEPRFLVPSPSNHISSSDIASGQVMGGPGFMKIRPDEEFIISNEQFETIVSSALQGGMTDFVNNLLYLVDSNILEVLDNGTPMTPKQIIEYQAP